VNSRETTLEELFQLADRIGKKRYHKLTAKDFENYRKFDFWRYINGDGECGTTTESKAWVRDNSDWLCPICSQRYTATNGRSIDHKLPRAQYPWLSLDFRNLWVICQTCNEEKAEMHWYEYEHYIFVHHPQSYPAVHQARPVAVLKSLKSA
jgi:5-methylcytosine-specific restriction endonuclease McrA